jgi:hypothetical protein
MTTAANSTVVGVFHDIEAFESALQGLLAAGFGAAAISVLGTHDAIVDRFGEVPDVDAMADSPQTPREALDVETTLDGVIDFIAGTLAVVTEVGAAAAAYAVGGPVGVAAGAADATGRSVDSLLSDYVDDSYRERFEENLRDGGLVCWVHTQTAEESARATGVLSGAGGAYVHATTA